MDTLSTIFALISAITTVLSVIFAILAFGRNKGNDNKEIESRLTKIETDILYIRQQLESNRTEDREWKTMVEKRISKLEQKIN